VFGRFDNNPKKEAEEEEEEEWGCERIERQKKD